MNDNQPQPTQPAQQDQAAPVVTNVTPVDTTVSAPVAQPVGEVVPTPVVTNEPVSVAQPTETVPGPAPVDMNATSVVNEVVNPAVTETPVAQTNEMPGTQATTEQQTV